MPEVKLNGGTNYGACGKGFIRLNVATQTAVLKKSLECMKKAAPLPASVSQINIT